MEIIREILRAWALIVFLLGAIFIFGAPLWLALWLIWK